MPARTWRWTRRAYDIGFVVTVLIASFPYAALMWLIIPQVPQ